MALNINDSIATFKMFTDFAQQRVDAGKGKSIARANNAEVGGLAGRTITAAKGDWVGNVGRLKTNQRANNDARTLFRDAIAGMFGGESRIPESVKKAMLLADYGKGKPLTARRIMAVKAAIENAPPTRLTPEKALETAKANIAPLFGGVKRNGLPVPKAEIEALAEAAVKRAGGDLDALEVVVNNITRILVGGDGIRSADDVRDRVGKIIDNLEEIREAAAGDEAIVTFGMETLKENSGKALAKGMFASMIRLSRTAEIGDIAKITAKSSIGVLHKGVTQFKETINAIAMESGVDDIRDAYEKKDCHIFIGRMLLAKCGTAASRNIQTALNSDTAVRLNAIYDNIAHDNFDKSVVNGGLRFHTQGQGNIFLDLFGAMYFAANANLGATPEDCRKGIPDYVGEIDMNGAEVRTIIGELRDAGDAICQLQRKQFAEYVVKGSGDAVQPLRDMYLGRMGKHPDDIGRIIGTPRDEQAQTLLNWNMAAECKKFATGKFEETAFAKDRASGPKVMLPGDVELSRNPIEARDQIASVLTKGAKKTFGDLDPAQQKKAWIVMSFLSGEMGRISHEAENRNLAPKSADMAYETESDPAKEKQTITLRLFNGGLEVSSERIQQPRKLIVGDGNGGRTTKNLGEGSTIRTTASITLWDKGLNSLAGQDFSAFDDSNLTTIMNGPGSRMKLDEVANGFPKEFRFPSVSVKTTANYDLR